MKKLTHLKYSKYLSKFFIILTCNYLSLSCGSEEVINKKDRKEQENPNSPSQSPNKPNVINPNNPNDEKTKNTKEDPINTNVIDPNNSNLSQIFNKPNDIDSKKTNFSTPAHSNQVILEKDKILFNYKDELRKAKTNNEIVIILSKANTEDPSFDYYELYKFALNRPLFINLVEEILNFIAKNFEKSGVALLEYYKYVLDQVPYENDYISILTHAANIMELSYEENKNLYIYTLDRPQYIKNWKEILTLINNINFTKGINSSFLDIQYFFTHVLKQSQHKDDYLDILAHAKRLGLSDMSRAALYKEVLHQNEHRNDYKKILTHAKETGLFDMQRAELYIEVLGQNEHINDYKEILAHAKGTGLVDIKRLYNFLVDSPLHKNVYADIIEYGKNNGDYDFYLAKKL